MNTKEWNELVYELSKYKWLYKITCHIIHDMDGVELEEVQKSIEELWDLKRKMRAENGGETDDH